MRPSISPHHPQDDTPLRRRCRNVRCGAKLAHPTDNSRRAFCCSGCFESYHRSCCVVCGRPFRRQAEHQRFCRPKCRVEFSRHPEKFSYPTQPSASLRGPSVSPAKSPTFSPTKAGRPFHVVAGPDLSPRALQAAAIPLEPELVARLARAHAPFEEYLRKAQRAASRKALIKRRHPPVNIVGGYRFPDAPAIDLSPIETPTWAVASRWEPTGDGSTLEDIAEFLNRRKSSAVQTRPAAKETDNLVPEVIRLKVAV